MDEDTPSLERTRRVDEIDARTDAPNVRAQRIWHVLRQHAPNESNWDVLCFAVEYVGMLSPEFPWLEDVARALAARVYTAHYAKEGLYDGPTRSSEPFVEPQHRSPNMGGEPKEISPRIVLASGFIGGRKKNIEPALHIRDNRPRETEGGCEETTRDDVSGNSRGDAGRND